MNINKAHIWQELVEAGKKVHLRAPRISMGCVVYFFLNISLPLYEGLCETISGLQAAVLQIHLCFCVSLFLMLIMNVYFVEIQPGL